ncbi:hypothetical protein EUGRSUZ_G00598 [Eucalyptus grandis]|uniref:Uncharacterized protein n=2 Tax=Eucalyptus grandis TaxID=71139 RepID=A0ACC3K1M3_EUCGR|nr:hypothetical protein EUGRSUZ_G00598 [Eucalyptus grandis]
MRSRLTLEVAVESDLTINWKPCLIEFGRHCKPNYVVVMLPTPATTMCGPLPLLQTSFSFIFFLCYVIEL